MPTFLYLWLDFTFLPLSFYSYCVIKIREYRFVFIAGLCGMFSKLIPNSSILLPVYQSIQPHYSGPINWELIKKYLFGDGWHRSLPRYMTNVLTLMFPPEGLLGIIVIHIKNFREIVGVKVDLYMWWWFFIQSKNRWYQEAMIPHKIWGLIVPAENRWYENYL